MRGRLRPTPTPFGCSTNGPTGNRQTIVPSSLPPPTAAAAASAVAVSNGPIPICSRPGPIPFSEQVILKDDTAPTTTTTPSSNPPPPPTTTTTHPPEDAVALLNLSKHSSSSSPEETSPPPQQHHHHHHPPPPSLPPPPSSSPPPPPKPHLQIQNMILRHQQQQFQNTNSTTTTTTTTTHAKFNIHEIDFAAGVLLRNHVLKPLGGGKSVALDLGKFFRGERVLLKTFPSGGGGRGETGNVARMVTTEDLESRKRKGTTDEEAATTTTVKKIKTDPETDDPQPQSRDKPDEGIYGCPQSPPPPSSSSLPQPTITTAQIQRCTGKDASILSSWYRLLGDKHLPYSNESWSEWWERRCSLPDPGCEMIKLVIHNAFTNQWEILGVAYYERNVLDRHLEDAVRVTLLRGIRVAPAVNREALKRMKLNHRSSTEEDTVPLYKGIASILLNHVVMKSLLCGTAGVGVNCPKSDVAEGFYWKKMGEAMAWNKEDGRKYFRMLEEERWGMIREQFMRQCRMLGHEVGRSVDEDCGVGMDCEDRKEEEKVASVSDAGVDDKENDNDNKEDAKEGNIFEDSKEEKEQDRNKDGTTATASSPSKSRTAEHTNTTTLQSSSKPVAKEEETSSPPAPASEEDSSRLSSSSSPRLLPVR